MLAGQCLVPRSRPEVKRADPGEIVCFFAKLLRALTIESDSVLKHKIPTVKKTAIDLVPHVRCTVEGGLAEDVAGKMSAIR